MARQIAQKKTRSYSWAVVRDKPWHLVGIYATEDGAKSKRSELNGEHEVHYGSHRLGSDDFMSVGLS
ncbi:hypothetical protein O5583_11225 [Escherichia coli]|nr:hypothetical protein [Escherichia coli]MCZ5590362.1 hypothetical protein [Escherichia coli]MCZ5593389.1 hypothetical protein [Escherichia coli]